LIGGSVAGATLGSIWGSARAARPENRPDIIVAVVDDTQYRLARSRWSILQGVSRNAALFTKSGLYFDRTIYSPALCLQQ
jgi:hypothetical protein